MDCSPPGSSVHDIFQARVLEGVAISFSRASSWPRDRSLVFCIAGRCFTIWVTREQVPKPSQSSSLFLYLHCVNCLPVKFTCWLSFSIFYIENLLWSGHHHLIILFKNVAMTFIVNFPPFYSVIPPEVPMVQGLIMGSCTWLGKRGSGGHIGCWLWPWQVACSRDENMWECLALQHGGGASLCPCRDSRSIIMLVSGRLIPLLSACNKVRMN